MTALPPYRDFVPDGRFADSIALSPDGATVAYITNDGGQFNLWTRPLAGGAATALTSFTDQSVRQVAWAPDGRRLAFLADRDGDEQTQVYVLGLDGGEPVRISKVDDRQYEIAHRPFSADGKRLFYAGNDRDEAAQDLIIHDLESDEVTRVDAQPGAVLEPRGGSPDGRWLLADVARSNTDQNVCLVDLDDVAAGARTMPAAEEDSFNVALAWRPDSAAWYLLTNAGREFRALAIGTPAGDVTPIAAPDWDVDEFVATPDGSVAAWIVNESGRSVVHVQRNDGPSQPLDLPTGVLQSCDITPDGSALVGLFGTATAPRELVVIDLASGTITALSDNRPPALNSITPIDAELVDYETHDGRRIPAWLYRPAGDGPHAIVLAIHGGPEAQEKAQYAPLYQYLLSRGIGVLAPNVRGSTGYGATYQKLIYRDWGGDELGDFEHAVGYLCTLDWVDPQRIGVVGGSFGGFATLSCVSRLPHLFAAGVSLVGPSNLVTFTRSVPPTWRPIMAAWVGDPDADHDFLMSRSPITYADQIVAPLMVVQGANDPRAVKAESDQIVDAMRARGVEVRYDVYEDEGHGFTRRENEIKALGDVGDFLVAQLT
jgi:dipeptidyl aminopeptidase/acylaminoacyl peptidase